MQALSLFVLARVAIALPPVVQPVFAKFLPQAGAVITERATLMTSRSGRGEKTQGRLLMDITIDTLENFSALKECLLSALDDKYNLQDDFLYELPRQGEIEINGIRWLFVKHGLGVKFTNEIHGAIDAHVINPNALDAFDGWEVLQYLESLGCCGLNERDIDSELARMEGEGKIRKNNESNFYRLP